LYSNREVLYGRIGDLPSSFSNPTKVSDFVSATIMAPQLDAAQHILIETLLKKEPKSVIVMDNASWHHSEKILQMCRDTGVVLEFLLPYSPDFNPIEEHFGVLKKFIKKSGTKTRISLQGSSKCF
jgi:hypothetical protein